MERRMAGSTWAAIGLVLCILGLLITWGWVEWLIVCIGILSLIYGGYLWAWQTPEHEDEAGDIHFDESAYPLP